MMIFYDYLSVFYRILLHFLILSSYGKSFSSFVYVFIYCVGAGISTLMSISDGLRTVYFPPNDGKDTVCKGRNRRNGVYFPPESAYFFCNYYD